MFDLKAIKGITFCSFKSVLLLFTFHVQTSQTSSSFHLHIVWAYFVFTTKRCNKLYELYTKKFICVLRIVFQSWREMTGATETCFQFNCIKKDGKKLHKCNDSIADTISQFNSINVIYFPRCRAALGVLTTFTSILNANDFLCKKIINSDSIMVTEISIEDPRKEVTSLSHRSQGWKIIQRRLNGNWENILVASHLNFLNKKVS